MLTISPLDPCMKSADVECHHLHLQSTFRNEQIGPGGSTTLGSQSHHLHLRMKTRRGTRVLNLKSGMISGSMFRFE